MAEKIVSRVGVMSFMVGVVLAILGGLINAAFQKYMGYNAAPWITSVLILMGLVVGFLNVTGKETQMFLLAAVSLVIVTTMPGPFLFSIVMIGPVIQEVLGQITVFVMAATIVVALKAIFALAKDE